MPLRIGEFFRYDGGVAADGRGGPADPLSYAIPLTHMPEPDQSAALAQARLFTDGGCSGNPGPGGWAFILRHPPTGKEIEQFGAEQDTTNNRMELMAVIRGLEALKQPTAVEMFTDSVYVGRGLIDWLARWKKNGWRTAAKKPVKNVDLWRRLDELSGIHRIKYTPVIGHSGHPENERCDELAVAAYQKFL